MMRHLSPRDPITERQMMIGVHNHFLRKVLGSITILSFGEPGSLGEKYGSH